MVVAVNGMRNRMAGSSPPTARKKPHTGDDVHIVRTGSDRPEKDSRQLRKFATVEGSSPSGTTKKKAGRAAGCETFKYNGCKNATQ